MKHDNALIARRNWLRSAARYVLLGGIGLITLILFSRSGGKCLRFTLPCQECELLAHCGLPRARQTRGTGKSAKAKP